MGAKLLNCFCWSVQKLHIGRVGSTSSSSSSRADNYNAYHKLAVAVAEVWGSAIHSVLDHTSNFCSLFICFIQVKAKRVTIFLLHSHKVVMCLTEPYLLI